MSVQLLYNGLVYSPADPQATALLIDQGLVQWVGQDAGARSIADQSMQLLDLQGGFLAPAFALGLARVTGSSIASLLDQLAAAGYCAAHLILDQELDLPQVSSQLSCYYYLPWEQLASWQGAEPGVKELAGIFLQAGQSPEQLDVSYLLDQGLSLLLEAGSSQEISDLLSWLEGLDPQVRLKLRPRLEGLRSLEPSLLDRAIALNLPLGFSSQVSSSAAGAAAALAQGALVSLGSDPRSLPSFLGWELMARALEVGEGLTARAAFQSLTRSVWRASGASHPFAGQLLPSAPADWALWEVGDLAVQSTDQRISAWSTDPRARTPQLPLLGSAYVLPRLIKTSAGLDPVG